MTGAAIRLNRVARRAIRRSAPAWAAAVAIAFLFSSAAAKSHKSHKGNAMPSTAPAVAASTAAAPPQIEISTVTGQSISFDNESGVVLVQGDAVVSSSSGTMKADKIQVDTNGKHGFAEGNVVVTSATGTLTADRADYDWDASTGVLYDASGTNGVWRFKSRQLYKVGDDVYYLYDGYITSCDAIPPHYYIATTRGKLRMNKRATLKNARFVADETPIIYMPWYTRSLVPKKYTLRIEPGHTSRDGYIVRSTLGYPFTPNTLTKFRWDWLENTGNGFGLEHRYFTPNVRGDFEGYYIRDVNPDPQPARSNYSVNWDHFQRFTDRLTANARFQLQNPQEFGNQYGPVGTGTLIQNPVVGTLSEAGLNYQWSKASLQAQADRNDRFDGTVSSANFISHLTLPRLTFNTAPLTWKYFPIYTSFTGDFINDTFTRDTPQETLRYRHMADANAQFRKDFQIQRKWTITPLAGYGESWQNRTQISTDTFDERDTYIGRYNAGGDVRRRVGRNTDLTLGYRWGERFRKNQWLTDVTADDRGVEQNLVSSSLVTRVGRDTRLSLSSGYDLRASPRSNPTQFEHQSARITPPTADLEWQVKQDVSVFFRETYGIFPARAPINTSGEVQFGEPDALTFFSHGFSYTRPATGVDTAIIMTDKARFYLTPKWYVDLFLSYQLTGPGGLDIHKSDSIEKTVRLVRDLHCWVFRMEFSKRQDRSEASFYIDLKVNARAQKNVFQGQGPPGVYDSRRDAPDVSAIFPNEDGDHSSGEAEKGR